MKIEITRHAYKRAHQRCGLPKKAVPRTAIRVFEKGQLTDDSIQPSIWIFKNKPSITSSRLILSHGNFNYVFELSGENPTLVTIIGNK